MRWSQLRTRLAPMPCKSHGVAVVEIDSDTGRAVPAAVMFGGMPSRAADMTSDVYLLPLGAFDSCRHSRRTVSLWRVSPCRSGTSFRFVESPLTLSLACPR